MISLVGTRCTPGLMLLSSFWRTIALRLIASAWRMALCLSGGNRSRMRLIVLAGAGGVNGAEHQVAGFGGVDGGLERVAVAHFADEDDVGVLAHGVLEGRVPVGHVEADFALVDDGFLVGEHELDRVFDGQNVQRFALVDVVEHRGDGRALAASR